MNLIEYARPVPVPTGNPCPPIDAVSGGAPISITIITPTLNRARFLAQAMESVARQAYPRLEHLIMDGGSTDDTLEVARRFPGARVVSAADAGSHDAMNKGLDLAQGEIVGFLNSDDFYADRTLWHVAAHFAGEPQSAAAFGSAYLVEDDSAGVPRTIAEFAHFVADDSLWNEILFGAPAFNSWFFRRSEIADRAWFDDAFSFAADRDFLIRLLLAGKRPGVIPHPVYYYRRHAESRTLDADGRAAQAMLGEHIRIADKHLAMNGVPATAKDRLRAWRALESYQLLRLQGRAGQRLAALRTAFGAMAADILFSLHLLQGRAARNRLCRETDQAREKEFG